MTDEELDHLLRSKKDLLEARERQVRNMKTVLEDY